tara:strand:- start:888 stop:2960 length:2073 start_codon:yes stop_codon:yes gene_type:complete
VPHGIRPQFLDQGFASAKSAAAISWAVFLLPAIVPFAIQLGSVGSPEVYKTYLAETGCITLLCLFWLERSVNPRPIVLTPLFWPIVALVFWSAISVSWAANSLAGLKAAGQISGAAVYFFLIVNSVHTANDVKRFATLLVFSGIALSALAFTQYLFDVDWVGKPPAGPAATFGNRNVLMHYLVLVIPLGMYFLWEAKARVVTGLLVIGLSIVGVVTTIVYARAAILATLIQGLVFVAFVAFSRSRTDDSGRKTRFFISSVAIGIIVVAVLQIPLQYQPQTADHTNRASVSSNGLVLQKGRGEGEFRDADSIGRRLIQWRATIRMIRDQPLFGVGAGNWHIHFPTYTPELAGDIRSYPVLNAHNSYLEFVANFGVIGLTLVIWVVVVLARTLLKIDRRSTSHNHLLICLLLCLVGTAINAFFSFNLELITPQLMIAAYIGILSKWPTISGAEISPKVVLRPNKNVATVLALIAAMLIFLVYGFNEANRNEERYYGFAAISSHQKDWDRAIHFAELARLHQPMSSRALKYVALGQMMQGRLADAETSVRRWLAKEPDHYEALSMLVYILPRLGLNQEGAEIARRCLALRPDDRHMLKNAAILSRRLDNGLADQFETRLAILDKAYNLQNRLCVGKAGHTVDVTDDNVASLSLGTTDGVPATPDVPLIGGRHGPLYCSGDAHDTKCFIRCPKR